MHISDLHFHRLSRRPARYASKRALGAMNLILRRRREFPRHRHRRLVQLLRELEWSHLLITGDLTQLGLEEEFALARTELAPLLEQGADRVTVIAGNHDRYVRPARGEQGFEAYFGEYCGNGEIPTRALGPHWWMAAWDSAVPAPWHSAAGRVRPETLAATERWLAELPQGARVIIANHYPVFFPPPHRYRPRHDLRNQMEVADWLQRQPVDLYLHGHVHHNWVMTLPGRQRTLTVVNSASSTQLPPPGAPSAFHRILLEREGFQVQPLRLE